mmetsp:Transcript_63902/g.157220  ORF Transcript_63902/g.157220 Transcript_63902/m.157220 type:complete len:205 (-) Transcript_63902:341-955(-)
MRSFTSFIDVSITMGMVLSILRICRHSSKPSILGMKTSEITMSGFCLWNFASASSPSHAAITKQLSFSRRLLTRRRSVSSSSTSRILGLLASACVFFPLRAGSSVIVGCARAGAAAGADAGAAWGVGAAAAGFGCAAIRGAAAGWTPGFAAGAGAAGAGAGETGAALLAAAAAPFAGKALSPTPGCVHFAIVSKRRRLSTGFEM